MLRLFFALGFGLFVCAHATTTNIDETETKTVGSPAEPSLLKNYLSDNLNQVRSAALSIEPQRDRPKLALEHFPANFFDDLPTLAQTRTPHVGYLKIDEKQWSIQSLSVELLNAEQNARANDIPSICSTASSYEPSINSSTIYTFTFLVQLKQANCWICLTRKQKNRSFYSAPAYVRSVEIPSIPLQDLIIHSHDIIPKNASRALRKWNGTL